MDKQRYTSLGSLSHRVMTGVARLPREDAYGLSIRRLIEARVGTAPSAAAVYMTLDRLERRGLVCSSESEPIPVRGGRRRRLYELTGDGLAALAEVERGLSAMRADAAEPPDKGASAPR